MPREASLKQKAMLRFIGVPFQELLTMDDASVLIEQAIDSGQYRERLDQWNWRKFKLHPDLYASELAGHQAGRIDLLHGELNNEEKREFIKRVTKAEVREIVAYLDQHFPNWDDDFYPGVWDYGLPAVKQLYPDRVKKGRSLRFPSAKTTRTTSSPNSGSCLSILAMFIVVVGRIIIVAV